MMKNTPGPLAPLLRSRPRRNMTALSYSWNIGKMNHGLDLSPALTVDSFSLPLNAYAIFHFCNKPIKIQTLDVFNLGHFAIREVTRLAVDRVKTRLTNIRALPIVLTRWLDVDFLWLGLTWTTLTTQQREKGSVRKMNTMEITIRRWAQIPWPSSQAAKKILN